MAMTSHIVYTAWDDANPATQSSVVIDRIIRGDIGFGGLLMSDDLDMEALSGSVPERAARAIAAGCDVALNCWARMDDMVGIANACPAMSEAAQVRLEAALAQTACGGADAPRRLALAEKRDALLALGA
jgi:beta-N-acetylhexosaminidase